PDPSLRVLSSTAAPGRARPPWLSGDLGLAVGGPSSGRRKDSSPGRPKPFLPPCSARRLHENPKIDLGPTRSCSKHPTFPRSQIIAWRTLAEAHSLTT